MDQAKKDALKVQALTQRIAQLVAQYEEQLADFRAEASVVIEALNAKVAELTEAANAATDVEANFEVSETPDASDED